INARSWFDAAVSRELYKLFSLFQSSKRNPVLGLHMDLSYPASLLRFLFDIHMLSHRINPNRHLLWPVKIFQSDLPVIPCIKPVTAQFSVHPEFGPVSVKSYNKPVVFRKVFIRILNVHFILRIVLSFCYPADFCSRMLFFTSIRYFFFLRQIADLSIRTVCEQIVPVSRPAELTLFPPSCFRTLSASDDTAEGDKTHHESFHTLRPVPGNHRNIPGDHLNNQYLLTPEAYCTFPLDLSLHGTYNIPEDWLRFQACRSPLHMCLFCPPQDAGASLPARLRPALL